MKIHPRLMIVQRARGEIGMAVWKLAAEHDLTYGEMTSILGGLLMDVGKYEVRMERHPDNPDMPGDEADDEADDEENQ